MKTKLLTLLILPILALTSCSCSMVNASTSKKIEVFNLDKKGEDVEDCYVGKVEARFKKKQGYVPYLSLRQYASLFESHYASGTVNVVSKKDNYVSWTVINDNIMYFIAQIDFKRKEVIVAGNLSAAFKEDDDPRDTASLYYGNRTVYSSKLLSDSYYAHYSFANEEIDCFSYMGDYYLPLSFYDITCSGDTGLYFFYNYKAIYSSVTVDTFTERNFYRGNNSYTVISEMNAYREDSSIPSYLLNLNSNLFLYLLDNFYGLKEYKGVKNAIDYCKEINTYDGIFSADDEIRTQAYAETLDRLDDNHTALVSSSLVWGSQNYTPRKYGTDCLARSALRGRLNRIRKEITSEDYYTGRAVNYSSDGTTALFFFNEFVYGSSAEVFNKDGSIKETARYHDSFYGLLAMFNEAKEHGVTNVVLDMATNGGGVLGVLMKLLALISNNNRSNLYYLEAASHQLGIATTSVDINDNGSYDELDCFGDDFDIYLLTSDCSFSCGNAFPCLAQEQYYATVIGEKSGGGECAVGVHYLPNGEYVYHSSNLHLGYYNETTEVFTGFENGAEPDIEINDYYDFFNVDRLSTIIQNS